MINFIQMLLLTPSLPLSHFCCILNTQSVIAPRSMSALLPTMRLVLILRNPVDRAYSEFHMKVAFFPVMPYLIFFSCGV